MNKLKQRIRSFKSILSIGAAMLCSISAWADVLYVDASIGKDEPDYGYSSSSPVKSIQRAVDMSLDGDKILVAPGVYNPFVAWKNEKLTIESTGGASKTIIDGGGVERCVTLYSKKMVFAGFTLRNGHATKNSPGIGYVGGGIVNATVFSCIIEGNKADGDGGGAYGCNLYNTKILNNSASGEGGGAHGSGTYDGEMILGCTVSGNASGGDGGGVYRYDKILNCSISNNTAALLGGGIIYASVVSNCVVKGNKAFAGGGIFTWGGEYYDCEITENQSTATSKQMPTDPSTSYSMTCGGGGVSGSDWGGGPSYGVFYNCKIHDNTSASFGGGALFVRLYNCHVYKNKAVTGAGGYALWAFSSLITENVATGNGGGVFGGGLYNCTVTKNKAGEKGGGVYTSIYAVGTDSSRSVACYNTIVYGNTADEDSSSADGFLGYWYNSCVGYLYSDMNTVKTGLIFKNPSFVDSSKGDYRLSSNSPCINAGDNKHVDWEYDYSGLYRIANDIVDIGAYEYNATPKKFKVTFIYDDYYWEGDEVSREVEKGKPIGNLPTPASLAPVHGYSFKGWFTKSYGGTQVTSETIISADTKIYAQWEYVTNRDMGFYTPDGWSQPFFVTTTSSSKTPVTSFKVGESIYLNYAFSNLASNDNLSNFVNSFKLSTGAYLDDSRNGLDAGYYGYLGSNNANPAFLQNLPVGSYTLTCTLDATGAIGETNESNNTRSITFTVVADDSGTEPPQPPPPPPPPPSKPELGVGDYSVAGDELVGTVPENAASVYDGYLYLDNVVMGTIQAKVSKPKVNKKLGVATTKTSVAIEITGEKKITLKGELNLNIGEFTVTDKKSGRVLILKFGSKGISGSFGKYEIDGARNFFDSKDKSEKTAAEEILKPYLGAYSMICDGGILSVNIAKKGKVTIKGAIDGNKVSAKAQVLIGEDVLCIPVIYSKKSVNLAFTIWLPIDGSNAEVIGLGDNAIIGKAGTLKNGAQFIIDGDIGASIETEDERTLELLPDNETITVSKSKWLVADGIKPAKVAYKKGEFTITEGKKGAGIVNPSGLKLSYKSKDGSFTGSFTAYAIVKGKLKKHKASVSGVLVNGIGYGTATIKKIGTWAIEIR